MSEQFIGTGAVCSVVNPKFVNWTSNLKSVVLLTDYTP